MKLEKIEVGGSEYYQFTHENNTGDLFSDWREIEYEKVKFKEQLGIE
jgi:hypothetical protein